MIIYMESTLALIAATQGPQLAQQIVSQGKLKQIEELKYIIINN